MGGGLDMGNGSGLVDVGGLGNGVGGLGDLGGHAGVGMGLSGGVGKVAAEPVALDGSGVMSGGPDQLGGAVADLLDGGDAGGGGASSGQDGCENDESLKFETFSSKPVFPS